MIVRPQGITFFAVFLCFEGKVGVPFGFVCAGVKNEKEGKNNE